MSDYQENEVFICYNRKDKLMVKPIAEALEEKGINVWFDLRKKSPGEDWEKKLANAIKKIKTVVVTLSKHGLGRVQRKEINVAFELDKKMIPVFLPSPALWAYLAMVFTSSFWLN